MKVILSIFLLLGAQLVLGQQSDSQDFPDQNQHPVNGITEKDLTTEKRILSYPDVATNDILWKKSVWREIDVRQLMNHPFQYEEMPFISVLLEEIEKGNITAYSNQDDQFSYPLTKGKVDALVNTYDTIPVYDPKTYEMSLNIVKNSMDPKKVTKYRIKEVWWFDSKYSTLKVRILGIAPIVAHYDDQGNYAYEYPLFWVNFPTCREALAQHKVFNAGNDQSPMTWNDWLEMRFFDSYITKVNNVHDRRIQDYLSGTDLLQESELLEQEIFNKEMDMWQR